MQSHRIGEGVASNDYHFITHWRVPGLVKEVTDILSDLTALPRWWPAVYLDIHELAAGDSNGVGRQVEVYSRALLPYSLRWRFTVTGVTPSSFTIEAHGDFEGRGIWTLEQAGDWVNIAYDWKIQARKPILRSLSFLLKPVFAANHVWAMARGQESLLLELERRRARTDSERDLIPPPPPPVATSTFPLALGAAGVLLFGFAWRRLRHHR